MASNAPRPRTASSSSGPASLSEQSTSPSPSPVVPPETSPASRRSTSTPRSASARAVAAPTIPAPTTTTRTARCLEGEAGGEGVGRVEQVLTHAGDPRAAGDLGDHSRAARDLRRLDEAAREARADDGLVHERAVEAELAARVQLGHPRRGPGPARRAVEPAGVDGDGGAGVGAVAPRRGEDHVAQAGDAV